MSSSYVMKVSSNGQVSIPSAARSRWNVDRVVVVDLGDRVVIRPLPADRVGSLTGTYRGRGSTTERAPQAARAEEVANGRHKRG